MFSTQDEDRAALIAAIKGEHAAWVAKDYDRWASYWLQIPAACHWGWTPELGVTLLSGWDQIGATGLTAMKAFPEPESFYSQIVWHHFLITPEMALVIHDQLEPHSGQVFVDPGQKREMKILVRDHGRWLHLAIVSIQPTVERAHCPVVKVDSAGRIQWQNELALKSLANHPGLAIRAGRLRARSRVADRDLQAAIKWAAGALAGPTKRVALTQVGVISGALPIFSPKADHSPPILCWVQPSDGAIIVSLDGAAEVDRRLSAATLLFGLSASQQLLVRHLANGRDLVDAAREMKVSVNTLRTQLRRIYNKTNVHNQAALLRLMLSVAPPL